MAWSHPKGLVPAPQKATDPEGILGPRRKKTKKKARVGACRCASVQQSLPRRNFTARHGRQSLRAIPGCMSSWATNTRQRRYVPTSDFILQCEIGRRRTGTDSPFLTTQTRQPNPQVSQPPSRPFWSLCDRHRQTGMRQSAKVSHERLLNQSQIRVAG